MKKYKKYKDSGIEWIGDVPEKWEIKRMKDILNFGTGLSITKQNLQDTGVPCVNYGEIHSKYGFEIDTAIHRLKNVSPNYIESSAKALIKTGDFVFADTSEDIEGAGNFTYLKSKDDIFAGYHTVTAKPSKKIDSCYFAYEFESLDFRAQIRKSVKGIKVFSVTQSILKNTKVWIPDNKEQTQIANYLDHKTKQIDELITDKQKLIELLKEERTATINQAVTKGLNPNVQMKYSGIEWLGDIPVGWEVKRLKYLVKDLLSGVSVNSEDTPAIDKDKFGILKTSCVFNYKFEPQKNKQVLKEEYSRVKCSVSANSIIISRMNTPDLVGASGFSDKDYPNLFLPDRLWKTEFFADVALNVRWLSQVLISDLYKKTISSKATGTSPSMKNISKGDFLTMPIPFPSYNEQNEMAQYVVQKQEEIHEKISKIQDQIALLKEYKTALISEVVTGKVDIRDEVLN